MRYALLLILLPLAAPAGTPKYNCYTLTISSAACPTGTPGSDAEGELNGLGLQQLRGWKARICPVTAGATITGSAGSVRFCTYSAPPFVTTAGWALSPQANIAMTTALATSADHPCMELSHQRPEVRLSGERVYAYVSTDFAVSAGTQVLVCMAGELEQ